MNKLWSVLVTGLDVHFICNLNFMDSHFLYLEASKAFFYICFVSFHSLVGIYFGLEWSWYQTYDIMDSVNVWPSFFPCWCYKDKVSHGIMTLVLCLWCIYSYEIANNSIISQEIHIYVSQYHTNKFISDEGLNTNILI